jgi:hypothetical protein
MNDPMFPEPMIGSEGGKKNQSKLGIASFSLSLAGFLVFCLAMVISIGYGATIAMNNPQSAQNPYQAIDTTALIFIIAAILSWCGPILSLVGVGLGIPAVIQAKDKKVFGILGLVIGALVVLIFCGLEVFGLSMGQI